MSLWTAQDAARATSGRVTTDWEATGVSIDTRTLAQGDLFVALKDVRDGHDFVRAALEKGAAAALVTHIPDDVPKDAPLLLVDDVLVALEALGAAARARCDARVLAITGSVGKTSTKEMMRAMLDRQGKTHASVASYNNHWGVPLTLARMPADTEYAIIEIGMNHPGEIAPLSRLARPHVALVTTVAPAHLEAFESIEGIAEEKASILQGLEPGGVAVLNSDCSTAQILNATAEKLDISWRDFGKNAKDYKLLSAQISGGVTIAEASINDASILFKLSTAGVHFATNALGALGAAQIMGADLAQSIMGLSHWRPYEGRGVREAIMLDPAQPELRFDLIDDSYNANPASMAASLAVLAASEIPGKGRRIAILGDMKELGSNGAQLHRDIASLEAMGQIDSVYAVGALMGEAFQALPISKQGDWAPDVAALMPHILDKISPGDVVLVKASLSMKLGQIVDALRKMGQGKDR